MLVDVFNWVLSWGWKVLLFVLGWQLFKRLVNNGGETLGNLLDTMFAAINCKCSLCRKRLIKKLKKENGIEDKEPEDGDEHVVWARIE